MHLKGLLRFGFAGMISVSPLLWAAAGHDKDPKPQPSNPEALEPIKPVLPEDPLDELKLNKVGGDESKILSQALLFWSVTNGSEVDSSLAKSAGLDSKKWVQFEKTLKASDRPSRRERESLRANFESGLSRSRLSGRRKMVKLVKKLDEEFPEFRGTLAELLTVWGEARDVKGFKDEDDLLQQAKMASIVHVLRNRSERLARRERTYRPLKARAYHEVLWGVATKRYQFSAFEPYDPNLAEITFGPKDSIGTNQLSDLPKFDKKALSNLAKVIARINRGEILFPLPLGDKRTRNYLTPVLIPFTRSVEKRLKAQLVGSKTRILRIPTTRPRFIAVVPRWAEQRYSIFEPSVSLQHPESGKNVLKSIPYSDFVYFKGVR